jgi:hypothetical protein
LPQSVCYFHDFDLDERGWRNTHPEISCRACRSDGYFSKEQINKYFAAHFRFTAIYTRRVGYPEQLNVIMLPNDRLYEAERIAPRGGGFHLDEIVFTDPYVHLGNNTITLIKPPSGKTLQDIREKWDHGSRHKNEIENDLIRKPIAYIVDATQAIIESIGLEKEKLNRLTMAKTAVLSLSFILTTSIWYHFWVF